MVAGPDLSSPRAGVRARTLISLAQFSLVMSGALLNSLRLWRVLGGTEPSGLLSILPYVGDGLISAAIALAFVRHKGAGGAVWDGDKGPAGWPMRFARVNRFAAFGCMAAGFACLLITKWCRDPVGVRISLAFLVVGSPLYGIMALAWWCAAKFGATLR